MLLGVDLFAVIQYKLCWIEIIKLWHELIYFKDVILLVVAQ